MQKSDHFLDCFGFILQWKKNMATFIKLGLFILTIVALSQGLMASNELMDHYIIRKQSKMDELLGHLITSCYQDPYPVVVYDNYDYNLAKVLQTSKPISLVSYNPLEIFHWGHHHHQPVNTHYSEKANFVFISNESIESFREVLPILQHASWWNHMAVFIIIDQSSNGCKRSRKLLRMLWHNDVLTSFYLCYDEDGRLVIFTFNPFTNRAPVPWKLAGMVGDRKYHPWTLYHRIYHNQGSKICENFNFDRTRHFDGYNKSKALICISEEKLWSTSENFTKARIIRQHTYITNLMKRILNLDFTIAHHFINLSNITVGNNYRDTIAADLFVCSAPMWEPETQVFHFHPVVELEAVIVSRYRGMKTPLEIIADFYGFLIISMTIVILFITYCVIIVSQNHQNYSFAFFEVLRLLRNTGIVSNISSLHLRIFFMIIFFYFLVLHATFSGHLSAFLTHSKMKSFPQTLDDLKSFSIKKVFVPYTIKIDHLDSKVKKKIVTTHDLNCKILFNVSTFNYACITFKPIIINYLMRKKLVMSRNYVIRDHFSYSSRHTWPLNQRINEFIMRLEQSKVVSHRIDSYMKSVQDNIIRTISKRFTKYRPIKINDLLFAFYFLLFGLSIATISFIIEIIKN